MRVPTYRLLVALSFCVLVACASRTDAAPLSSQSPAATATVDTGTGTRLDALLAAEHEQGTFDGVVLVSDRGQAVLRKGYGLTNRRPRVAADPSAISDIGSLAKTFTAAAILHLESRGMLSLDDPLAKFFDDASEAAGPITVRQLLTHRSGLDDFHADDDFEEMTRQEAEARILALSVKFTPGEEEAYSNAGYTLLAAIVERVSGRAFQDYTRDALLRPAGLSDTGWYGDPSIEAARVARGYGGRHAGRTTFERPLTWALTGAGGMVSTADDLLAWFNALSTRAQMLESTLQIFEPVDGGRWSVGSWRTLSIDGSVVIDMGGSTDFGYTAKVMQVPSTDTVVVLLLNAHSQKYGAGTHHALGNRVLLPAILEAEADTQP